MNPVSNIGSQQPKIQTNSNNQIQQPHHGKHHNKVENNNNSDFSKLLETAQQTNKAK